MSARTCQLCGKTLSRIWVGAGGDFCSREHRNQYRLRLGMDRLQEANKVATLMRRRENLKPVITAQVESVASLIRRSVNGAAHWTTEGKLRQAMPALRPFMEARVQAHSGQFLPPPAQAGMNQRAAQTFDYAPALREGRKPFPAPQRVRELPVTIPDARVALVRYHMIGEGGQRRDYGILRNHARRVYLGGRIRRQILGESSAAGLSAGARALVQLAREGRALRVSSGGVFRFTPLPIREFAARELPPVCMTWPSILGVETAIHQGHTLATIFPGMEPPPQMQRIPRERHPYRGNGIVRRNLRAPRIAFQDIAAERRMPKIAWNSFGEADMVLSSELRIKPGMQNGAWNGFRARPMAMMPAGHGAVPQVALVPFEPQESPFGYSSFEIHASIPSEPAVEAHTEAPAVDVTIEERFDSGWANWIGGTGDWKVDVAGVRTGSFALFVPSLHLTDYDLEFLARIDQRSITWVFRASDETEYQMARIANGPGGRSFTRSTVVDGVPGLSVTKTVRMPANPKSAITVQTRVRGSEFTVLADGEAIDRWTDSRLPIGGIGFVGSPDDRARLYWIRVSAASNTGKEKDRP